MAGTRTHNELVYTLLVSLQVSGVSVQALCFAFLKPETKEHCDGQFSSAQNLSISVRILEKCKPANEGCLGRQDFFLQRAHYIHGLLHYTFNECLTGRDIVYNTGNLPTGKGTLL